MAKATRPARVLIMMIALLAELSGIGCIPRSQGRQRLSTALILPPVPDNCGEKSVENTRDAEEGRECVQNRCLGRE